MADQSSAKLAVLIDAENMPASNAELIFDEIAKYGEANVRRAYGDFLQGSTKPWLDKLASLAITPFHQPKNSVGKNASDIALVIDAMDLLNSNRLDGFFIVSSDSDFTKLAQRIREHGIDVWGIGRSNTPEAFRTACKQFITVENLSAPEVSAASEASEKKPLNHAFQLISNVISDTSDPDGWAGLSWLGDRLTKRYSDFDARTYGFRRLSDLVRKIEKLEVDQNGGQRVRLKS